MVLSSSSAVTNREVRLLGPIQSKLILLMSRLLRLARRRLPRLVVLLTRLCWERRVKISACYAIDDFIADHLELLVVYLADSDLEEAQDGPVVGKPRLSPVVVVNEDLIAVAPDLTRTLDIVLVTVL